MEEEQKKGELRMRIDGYRNELAKKDELTPDRASKILVELSALLGNLLDQIRFTEIAYNKVLLACYDQEKTANRAKIKAETTPEYDMKLEARNYEKVTNEMIRSIKYFLRGKEEEYRQAGNQ